MKHIFGIFLALFLVQGAYAESATVEKVIDGDTILVILDGAEEGVTTKVRLKNADAPEPTNRCIEENEIAKKAYELVSGLLPQGTIVNLKNAEKKGKHSGLIANVVLADGSDIGNILLKEKLGVAYNPDPKKRKNWCPDTSKKFVAKKHFPKKKHKQQEADMK